jgi:hypothetical protein
VDTGYETCCSNIKRESEISQRDISPFVWGCLAIRENSKTHENGIYTEMNIHNTRKWKKEFVRI